MPNLKKASHRLSVTIPDEAYDFIKETSRETGKSAASIFRALIYDNLDRYLGTVRYVSAGETKKIREAVYEWARAYEGVRKEVNAIGRNYNQAVRIENEKRHAEEARKARGGRANLTAIEEERRRNIEGDLKKEDALKAMTEKIEILLPLFGKLFDSDAENAGVIRSVLYGKQD